MGANFLDWLLFLRTSDCGGALWSVMETVTADGNPRPEILASYTL